MAVNFSEVLNLALAVAMTPLIISVIRRLNLHGGRPYLLMGYFSVVVSYVLTILEGVGGQVGEVFNVLEHAALLGGGVLFAFAARQTRQRSIEAAERS